MNSSTTFSDGTACLLRRWEADDPWCHMLIVHGLGEHSGRYDHVGAAFAAEGVDTRAFDLRGFGRSGGRRAYVNRFEDHLDDISVRLGDVTGRPRVLLGHSLGGLLALSYAVSGRPQPDYLVLSAPALQAAVPKWQRRTAPVLGRILPGLRIPNSISADQLSTDPTVGKAYFSDPLVNTKTTAHLGAEVLRAMEKARRDASRLSMPTLVIHGGDDTLVPVEASAPLAVIDGVTRVVIEGFHHESFNEADRRRAPQIVLDWLRSQTSKAA